MSSWPKTLVLSKESISQNFCARMSTRPWVSGRGAQPITPPGSPPRHPPRTGPGCNFQAKMDN